MIVCIGDSFTAGDELPDWQFLETPDKSYPTSELAWPNLLSQKLNFPVKNLGRGACGNTRLVKKAMDLCLKENSTAIVIAWTNPERIELADDHGIWDSWAARRIDILNPYYRTKIVKYTAAYQNSKNIEHWYYKNWLRQVIMLQNFFKAKQQKYLMLQSHMTEYWNGDYCNLFRYLFDEVDDKYFLGWPNESMMEWTKDCPQGPGGHFLEQGHEIVAQKVFEHIRSLGWLS